MSGVTYDPLVLLLAGSGPLVVVLVGSVVVPLVVLAIVIWVFFRSARRFDAEQRRQGKP